MTCRPKASGLQFCGSVVYCSWLFLDVIGYEADILIYKQPEIRLLNSTETVTFKEKHIPSSAELFLKPGVRERNFFRGVVKYCSSEANSCKAQSLNLLEQPDFRNI
jgi:hypothetical protein